ncbi:hypothetical protein GCM10011613_19360 [Cellvibrio zantedeschiae]|uniref:DUF3530 domain-containing protein n=1 Tax=Cellvibrio zantedeschiae TaxID=1237077 RepID=A0ABQ3B2B7_9GAMM|nr:DUF3530 family protein [Cellvibrio zantedeschiae]GGY74141.1 hypothetical protein GCM10011613_19360 [Cellvibrio zantedeschiae]
MFPPNRLLQYTPKLCVAFAWICLSNFCFAQDPAAESSASSAASSAAPEKPIYANNVERDNALLTKAFTAIAKADELQPIETPDEKIITLFKNGETRQTKGALLIMHAPEVPQLWPATLENLRRNLPLYSWATMALPLPAKYQNTVPERESASASSIAAETESSAASSSAPAEAIATTSSASSEPAKPLIPRNKLISDRVEAAVAQLNKIGQFNLVVLVDNSSAPDALATLYKKINKSSTTNDTVDGPLQALILVNLQNQEPLTKEQLADIFSVGDLPVMDVFFNPDNTAQAELRRIHHAEAMRKNLKDYQQLILPSQPPVSVDDKQNFWLAKIHGFVARKAEGNELQGGSSNSSNLTMK